MLFVRTDRIYFARDTLSVPFCAQVINLKWRKRDGRPGLKMSLLPTQAIYCMGRVPLLRQPCCSQPCSQPAGACSGRIWALWYSELLPVLQAVPSLAPYNRQVYAKGEYGLYGEILVTCPLATSQFPAWCHTTSRCMQMESVGCAERCPFLGPRTAYSPTANQQVHAKVAELYPFLLPQLLAALQSTSTWMQRDSWS